MLQSDAIVEATNRFGAEPTPIPTTDENDSMKTPITSSARWASTGPGFTQGPVLSGERKQPAGADGLFACSHSYAF